MPEEKPPCPRFDPGMIRLACADGDLAAIADLASAVEGELRRREAVPPLPTHPEALQGSPEQKFGEPRHWPNTGRQKQEIRKWELETKRLRSKGAQPDTRSAASRGAISDSEAGNYAYRMLKACASRQHAPPGELVSLIQILLHQDRPPRGFNPKGKVEKMQKAIDFLRDNPTATAAAIARKVKVSRSTVARWMQKGKLVRCN